ncbi:hypothetical protein BOX15_Mlig008059g2, partial [Macrostomum lignano]
FLSMKKKCRSFRSRPRKTSAWSMFLKTMGTNNFSKERMAFLSDKFKSLTAEEKSVYERAAREKVQQTPSVHTLEDLARLMFADYHIIIITKSRSGSNIRTCASPEVAGILNDNIGVLQKFELLSTGLAQSSAQKPTVEHMRKEVRASVRMAYAQAGMGAKLNFNNLGGSFFPSIKRPALMNYTELRELYDSRDKLKFIPHRASAADLGHLEDNAVSDTPVENVDDAVGHRPAGGIATLPGSAVGHRPAGGIATLPGSAVGHRPAGDIATLPGSAVGHRPAFRITYTGPRPAGAAGHSANIKVGSTSQSQVLIKILK